MKRFTPLVLSAALLLAGAVPASASPCTDGYMRCLNDSAELWEPLRSVADLVCFDDYLTCVYWAFIRG